MMSNSKFLFAAISLSLLAACGTSPRKAPVDDLTMPGRSESPFVPPQESGPEGAETFALPGAATAQPPADSAAPPGQAQTANPAVVALLNDANLATQNGRHDRAAASIERALAIEPRNAWLWHRLARIRLEQGDLGQAAALAAKSHSLASADRSLQADNWRIIAEVHRRRGELTAARSAERKAAELSARTP